MTTAKETAYNNIRAAIFSGEFKPGFQLKEESLASKFGVSRTPVRQAIRTLADEGLVDIRSNRRSYVAEIAQTQFEQVFDLLAFLESYSASLAATNVSDETIDKLRSLNEAMGRTTAPRDNREFLELNSEFHRTIHECSDSQKVQELLTRVVDFPHILYLKFNQIPDWHNEQSVVEHGLIVEALASRDPQFAASQMKAHTESVRHAFRKLWRSDTNDKEDD